MRNLHTVDRPCPVCSSTDRTLFASGKDYEYGTCDHESIFVRCHGCGVVYLTPVTVPEEIPLLYPANYKPFHFADRRKSVIMRVRDVLETRKARSYLELLPERARVLDVGCGDGRYMTLLKRVNPRWQVEGIDFGEDAVARARRAGLEIVHGDYEKTPLRQSSYDLMILNQVIEHIVDIKGVMEKIRDELKPGGLLSIETPSLDGWDRMLFSRRYWGGYHFPRHMTLFDAGTMREFLDRFGFRVLSTRYLYSPVFWVFSVHHWLQNTLGIGAGFFSDSNAAALAAATALDIVQIGLRNRTSNMQVVARCV